MSCASYHDSWRFQPSFVRVCRLTLPYIIFLFLAFTSCYSWWHHRSCQKLLYFCGKFRGNRFIPRAQKRLVEVGPVLGEVTPLLSGRAGTFSWRVTVEPAAYLWAIGPTNGSRIWMYAAILG